MQVSQIVGVSDQGVSRPYQCYDEQACIGVIVRCPSANFYGYRLAQGDETAISRITAFFPRHCRR